MSYWAAQYRVLVSGTSAQTLRQDKVMVCWRCVSAPRRACQFKEMEE